MRDPYEVLGVERSSTQDEIKSAFRRLAAQHHPDKNPGDQGAHVRFKKLDRPRLEAALRSVLRPEVQERARVLGERIRAEGDGLPAAATALDDWLVTAEPTPAGTTHGRARRHRATA